MVRDLLQRAHGERLSGGDELGNDRGVDWSEARGEEERRYICMSVEEQKSRIRDIGIGNKSC